MENIRGTEITFSYVKYDFRLNNLVTQQSVQSRGSHTNLKQGDTMKQVQSADNKQQPFNTLLAMMTYLSRYIQDIFN